MNGAMHKRVRLLDDSGVSIVEMLIAASILAVACVTILSNMISSDVTQMKLHKENIAFRAAQQALSIIQRSPAIASASDLYANDGIGAIGGLQMNNNMVTFDVHDPEGVFGMFVDENGDGISDTPTAKHEGWIEVTDMASEWGSLPDEIIKIDVFVDINGNVDPADRQADVEDIHLSDIMIFR